MLGLIGSYTTGQYAGPPMRPLPPWLSAGGAILGLEGGQANVQPRIEAFLAAHPEAPVLAVWLQVRMNRCTERAAQALHALRFHRTGSASGPSTPLTPNDCCGTGSGMRRGVSGGILPDSMHWVDCDQCLDYVPQILTGAAS